MKTAVAFKVLKMEKVEISELLSAYVCGDVAANERLAVELLLATNASARALEQDLRALLVTLKAGEKPVKATLLNALRERLKAALDATSKQQAMQTLLSGSLSNDLSSRERGQLESHLVAHPQAAVEIQSLRTLSDSLKSGELTVSQDMSRKLMERLNAKLPASAKLGQPVKPAASPVEANAPKSSVTVRTAPVVLSDRESLRVYAVPENHWPGRLGWTAAIAALVALAFGVSQNFKTPPQNPGVAKNNVPEVAPETVPVPELKSAVPDTQLAVKPRSNPGLEGPAPRIAEDKKAAPLQPERSVARDERMAQPQNQVTPQPQTPVVADQKPIVPPQLNDSKAVAEKKPREIQKSPRQDIPIGNILDVPANTVATGENSTQRTANSTSGVAGSTQNSTANTGTGGGIGTGANVASLNPTPSTPQRAPTSENKPATAVEGAAIVSLMRDGTAQAETAHGPQLIKQGEAIPLNSKISSQTSRLSLLLPGNGKLFVQRDSLFTLEINGRNTSINLTNGEISYQGPAGGTLTLTNGTVTVSRARTVDVKIETNNTLNVFVIKDTATLTVKGKPSVALKAGDKGSAVLNSVDAPQKNLFAGQPDSWRNDLDLNMGVTDDNRARSRRKK